MKQNKFTFFNIITFKYKKLNNNILEVDEYKFRKCFISKDKNFYDDEIHAPLIFSLETGDIIKYVDVTPGYINNNIYENQIYYTYDFNDPNEVLTEYEPTKSEFNKANAIIL